jgi:hypothetical protein
MVSIWFTGVYKKCHLNLYELKILNSFVHQLWTISCLSYIYIGLVCCFRFGHHSAPYRWPRITRMWWHGIWLRHRVHSTGKCWLLFVCFYMLLLLFFVLIHHVVVSWNSRKTNSTATLKCSSPGVSSTILEWKSCNSWVVFSLMCSQSIYLLWKQLMVYAFWGKFV